VNQPTLSKLVCILFVFCAATAIASSAQILTTLYRFDDGSDGGIVYAGLVQGADGNFYGTTEVGGANGSYGTVFRITSAGTLTTLHSFDGTDGSYPSAAPVQSSDGNFYGTADEGGLSGNCTFGCGTVFKITPSGTLTTLHSFDGADGSGPGTALVQGSDGNFYGTTYAGGANDEGTVFKITPSGTLTTLYSFCTQTNCSDGVTPGAALVQAADGNFYGTTVGGGANGNYGTVFKITPGGTLTTLYSFCSQNNCSDGYWSYAALVQATDGNLYGTTRAGGHWGVGTIFKITPQATLTTLHSFDGADGAYPYAGLVQATDGNFYGTTSSGGVTYNGTVFNITPHGALTTLHNFNLTDGANPTDAPVQATDGNFYGTTANGGGWPEAGTVFRLLTVRSCIVCPSVE